MNLFVQSPGVGTVRFSSDDDLTNFALDWLKKRGFLVTKPDSTEWMTSRELRERVAPHLCAASFHKRLTHLACPAFVAKRGPRGRRIRLIAPNPDLIAFLSLPKASGYQMERRMR